MKEPTVDSGAHLEVFVQKEEVAVDAVDNDMTVALGAVAAVAVALDVAVVEVWWKLP